ncbi:MAG: Riboflavin transporter [Hyphomicrobiaceae bacterium hypho_1]
MNWRFDTLIFRRQRLAITSVCAFFSIKWRRLSDNLRGAIYMLLAAFFFSLMIVFIKIVSKSLNVTEILFFRQLITISIAAPVILSNLPHSLHTAFPKLQFLRVVIAFVAMLLGCSAFIYLPFAKVTVIMFSKTLFITVLAIVILGEVVGPRRWGAIIMGFLGVLIIAWPNDINNFTIYSVMAIMSSICVSAVVIIIRVISRVDKPITIMTYQALGVGLLMVIPTIYFWKTPTLAEIVILTVIGICSTLGQYFNILSLRVAEASFVGPFDYARLIYSIAFGLLLFNEWPEQRVFLGAALIISAAAYTLHREQIKSKS